MPGNTGSNGCGPSILQRTVNICALVTQALSRGVAGKASGGRKEQAELSLTGAPLPLSSPSSTFSWGPQGPPCPRRPKAGRNVLCPGSCLPRPATEMPAPSSLYVGPVISTALAFRVKGSSPRPPPGGTAE